MKLLSVPLRLDWFGDAEIPAGAHVVETEVEWLSFAAGMRTPDENGVVVRGESLCEWASVWWRCCGGGYTDLRNRTDALLQVCPALDREGAKAVLSELPSNWNLGSQQWDITDVLASLFPDFGLDGLGWKRQIDAGNKLQIAAQWLLWLERLEHTSAHHALLLEQHAESWREQADDLRSLLPSGSQEAKIALKNWLGLERTVTGFDRLDEFPAEIPGPWQQEARKFYMRDLTQWVEGDDHALLRWWQAFERTNAPMPLRSIAANVMAQVLVEHPSFISSDLLARLETYLGAVGVAQLQAHWPLPHPPKMPDVKPSRAIEVLQWATDHYLPFRAWQCGVSDEKSQAASQRAARDFGDWYLKFYAGALAGAGKIFLQRDHAESLRTDASSEVVFWVIADGLGWLDARNLCRLVTARSTRLSLAEEMPCFATVPTITSFTKKALRWSTTPNKASDAYEDNVVRRETEVKGHREAAGALQKAAAGDLIIWTPPEPDKTYHIQADRGVLQGRIEGALVGLAENIVDAALSVPEDTRLKIIITTDHGRLLGQSERFHVIPEGFSAEGRAAHGQQRPQLADAGESDGVRWLDPDIYQLGSHVAVVMDEGAFLTNANDGANGRTGIEKFPHGGVYPEEIVVPWMVIERDAEVVVIEARISGRGRAGQRGVATLRVVNSSNKMLRLDGVEISYGGKRGSSAKFLEEPAPKFKATTFEIELDVWPSNSQAREASAIVMLRQPNGRIIETPASIELVVEEMQSRENILEDLI